MVDRIRILMHDAHNVSFGDESNGRPVGIDDWKATDVVRHEEADDFLHSRARPNRYQAFGLLPKHISHAHRFTSGSKCRQAGCTWPP